jgi:hypothetical protein
VISGTLSSNGNYKGLLGRIEASGHTDVPNFVATIAGPPIHLVTDHQAVIDGTSGNSCLQSVIGHTVVANDSVEGIRGAPGKTVSINAVVSDGRLEDMLLLGVHNVPPPRGAIRFHSKIVIPPGNIDVVQKLQIQGAFLLESAKFSQLSVQEGNPGESNPPTVASDFQGTFSTGFKSFLSKALDPQKKGYRAGAAIPNTTSATADKPAFELDLMHRSDR